MLISENRDQQLINKNELRQFTREIIESIILLSSLSSNNLHVINNIDTLTESIIQKESVNISPITEYYLDVLKYISLLENDEYCLYNRTKLNLALYEYEIRNLLIDENKYKQIIEKFYSVYDKTVNKILTEYLNSEIPKDVNRLLEDISIKLRRELLYNEELLYEFEAISALTVLKIITAGGLLFGFLYLIGSIFRIPQNIILSISNGIKKIGEYLKDIQKQNLRITEFFQNIPPECIKEFKDVLPELNLRVYDPVKLKSEDLDTIDKSKYDEYVEKLRKKFINILHFRRGLYDKSLLALSKGTECTLHSYISAIGIVLTTFYNCLKKSNDIDKLSQLLNIEPADIVSTDAQIMELFAKSVKDNCYSIYKQFKNMIKFLNDILEILYKEKYPDKYQQFLTELIEIITIAHEKGKKLAGLNKNSKSNKSTKR